jgi:hypothetical protein
MKRLAVRARDVQKVRGGDHLATAALIPYVFLFC